MLPTVVSFLCYRPEIIQSAGFELQIREEVDVPGGVGSLSAGTGGKGEERPRAGGGDSGGSRCVGTDGGQVRRGQMGSGFLTAKKCRCFFVFFCEIQVWFLPNSFFSAPRHQPRRVAGKGPRSKSTTGPSQGSIQVWPRRRGLKINSQVERTSHCGSSGGLSLTPIPRAFSSLCPLSIKLCADHDT